MDYLIGGIDQELAGNGGPDCYFFRSNARLILESLLIIFLALVSFKLSLKDVKQDLIRSAGEDGDDDAVRLAGHPSSRGQVVAGHPSSRGQVVASLFTAMLGMQLGYKMASKTLMWVLQPCHVITILQVYLLTAPVNKYTQILYRVHIGWLGGPFLACLFPVYDTYRLPFEIEMYWIQHIAILAVPLYLQTVPDFSQHPTRVKKSYVLVSYGTFLFYHILFLQPIALLTGVNISTVLCPAPTDPFYGHNYLLHAVWHQGVVIFLSHAVYSAILSLVSSLNRSSNNRNKNSNSNGNLGHHDESTAEVKKKG